MIELPVPPAHVPVILDPEEALQSLLDLDRNRTVAEVTRVALRLGRNDAPGLLYELLSADRLTADVATALAGDAWCAAEFPMNALGAEEWGEWGEWFDLAGFTVDGKAADPPAVPLTLYRGAPESRKDGMS